MFTRLSGFKPCPYVIFNAIPLRVPLKWWQHKHNYIHVEIYMSYSHLLPVQAGRSLVLTPDWFSRGQYIAVLPLPNAALQLLFFLTISRTRWRQINSTQDISSKRMVVISTLILRYNFCLFCNSLFLEWVTCLYSVQYCFTVGVGGGPHRMTCIYFSNTCGTLITEFIYIIYLIYWTVWIRYLVKLMLLNQLLFWITLTKLKYVTHATHYLIESFVN